MAASSFKDFILRGNVVDLAVGVVIGTAFNAVVSALVKDLLTPLIGAIVKTPDFSSLSFALNGSKFSYGDFLNAIISFLLIALAVYFFVGVPMNRFIARMHPHTPSVPATRQCPQCKSEIPKDASRCAHCTQPVA